MPVGVRGFLAQHLNGENARLLELKAENDKLRKELAILILAVRDVTARVRDVADALNELTDE